MSYYTASANKRFAICKASEVRLSVYLRTQELSDFRDFLSKVERNCASQYSRCMYEPMPVTRSKYIFPILVVSAWTMFGIFFGTQNYVRDVYAGNGAVFSDYLVSWLICGYSWALLTVPVLWFRKRFSLTALGWSRFLLVHIPASVVFALTQLGVYVLISGSLFGTRSGYFDFYKVIVVSEIQSSCLVYLAIVLAATAYYRFARQTRTQEQSSDSTPHVSDPPSHNHRKSKDWLRRLSVKENGRITLVDTNSIDLITTYGNYLFIQTANKRHIYRETMTAMEKRLDPKIFIRISRAAMVNVEKIKEFKVMGNGEFEVVLKDGSCQNSTRRYRKNLEAILKS